MLNSGIGGFLFDVDIIISEGHGGPGPVSDAHAVWSGPNSIWHHVMNASGLLLAELARTCKLDEVAFIRISRKPDFPKS